MDVTHFQEFGYQVLSDVIDADTIASVGAFLRQQAASSIAELNQALNASDIPSLSRQIDAYTANGRLEGLDRDLRMQMSGHYALADRLSESLWAIPRNDRLQQALRSILSGEQLFMHMPPTARFVLPSNGHAGVPAHQDVSYNKHLSNFVTIWVPFVPIDDLCGGVAVFRGSGHEDEYAVQGDGNFWLTGVSTEGYEKVHCTMQPGDVLALNPHVIHSSMPNVSDRIRYSVDCRFFAESGGSTKHYLDMQSWEVIEPQQQPQTAQSHHAAG